MTSKFDVHATRSSKVTQNYHLANRRSGVAREPGFEFEINKPVLAFLPIASLKHYCITAKPSLSSRAIVLHTNSSAAFVATFSLLIILGILSVI